MKFDARQFVADLPQTPGVYLMLNQQQKIIYVGKARFLKKRVASYFNNSSKDRKTITLVNQIAAMDYHLTRSESEALILENQLIKKHRPKYNILLKDDKSYPYIYVSNGEDKFPRVEFRRGKKDQTGQYLGPFPSANSVRQTLSFLQKVFKVRQCDNNTFNNRSRPCLQYQINRCTAPCVGLVNQQQYQQQLQNSFDFIDGKSDRLLTTLIENMEQAAEQMEYEQAAEYRDQIKAIRQVQSKQYAESGQSFNADFIAVAEQAGIYIATVGTVRNGLLLGYRNHYPKTPKDTNLDEFLNAFIGIYCDRQKISRQLICNLDPQNKNELQTALSQLQKHKVFISSKPKGNKLKLLQQTVENCHNALSNKLKKYATWQNKWQQWQTQLQLPNPNRVECFDISHQFGEHTRASCVVFDQTGACKTQYRQYIITDITAGDDYAAMQQVIEKRLQSLTKRNQQPPDILLIDGGKGQVAQAATIVQKHAISTTIIGVTKDENRTAGEERLFLNHRQQFIKPEKHGLLSLMIQQIRDEAHRFAISSHRQAYKKSRNTSSLQQIPGIGKKRSNDLLKHFGGLQQLKKAGITDISQVKGISQKTAHQIFHHLHR